MATLDITSNTKPHTIRFPADLYERLKDRSKEKMRTFNAQVIWEIEQGLLAETQDTLQNSKDEQEK